MTAKAKKQKATAAKKGEEFADCPTYAERAWVHVLLSLPEQPNSARNTQEACRRLGMDVKLAKLLPRRPRVRRYMTAYIEEFMKRKAMEEVDNLKTIGISRDMIAQRYLSLAMMPPERTRFTINGQVAALDGLSAILGFKIAARDMDEFFRGKSDEQVQNYLTYGSFEVPTKQ